MRISDWSSDVCSSDLLAAFARTYGNGITRENVLDALSAFHRSLITPNARFDQYLRGRDNAITAAEKRGYQLFKRLGCVSFHQGRNVGGTLFHKAGIFAEYFASPRNNRSKKRRGGKK